MDSKTYIIEGLSLQEYYEIMLFATMAKKVDFLTEQEMRIAKELGDSPIVKRVDALQREGYSVEVRKPWGI